MGRGLMKRSVYIFSNGEIKRKDNTLYFETEGERKYLPIENVKELLVFGEVEFNKKLLEFLAHHDAFALIFVPSTNKTLPATLN
jgi:CRISPR-associated protein Cas1